jgi:hypothetical protein
VVDTASAEFLGASLSHSTLLQRTLGLGVFRATRVVVVRSGFGAESTGRHGIGISHLHPLPVSCPMVDTESGVANVRLVPQ